MAIRLPGKFGEKLLPKPRGAGGIPFGAGGTFQPIRTDRWGRIITTGIEDDPSLLEGYGQPYIPSEAVTNQIGAQPITTQPVTNQPVTITPRGGGGERAYAGPAPGRQTPGIPPPRPGGKWVRGGSTRLPGQPQPEYPGWIWVSDAETAERERREIETRERGKETKAKKAKELEMQKAFSSFNMNIPGGSAADRDRFRQQLLQRLTPDLEAWMKEKGLTPPWLSKIRGQEAVAATPTAQPGAQPGAYQGYQGGVGYQGGYQGAGVQDFALAKTIASQQAAAEREAKKMYEQTKGAIDAAYDAGLMSDTEYQNSLTEQRELIDAQTQDLMRRTTEGQYGRVNIGALKGELRDVETGRISELARGGRALSTERARRRTTAAQTRAAGYQTLGATRQITTPTIPTGFGREEINVALGGR